MRAHLSIRLTAPTPPQAAELKTTTDNAKLEGDDNGWRLYIPFEELPISPNIVARGDAYVDGSSQELLPVWLGKIAAVEMRLDREPARLIFSGEWASAKARALLPG
jgi:hypothetical protein